MKAAVLLALSIASSQATALIDLSQVEPAKWSNTMINPSDLKSRRPGDVRERLLRQKFKLPECAISESMMFIFGTNAARLPDSVEVVTFDHKGGSTLTKAFYPEIDQSFYKDGKYHVQRVVLDKYSKPVEGYTKTIECDGRVMDIVFFEKGCENFGIIWRNWEHEHWWERDHYRERRFYDEKHFYDKRKCTVPNVGTLLLFALGLICIGLARRAKASQRTKKI